MNPVDRTAGLIARAPTRLDFGGGWTDVPPYSDDEGGFVCNIALARYATVRIHATGTTSSIDTRHAADSALAEAAVRRAGVEGIAVEIESDFPLGAGLGGSSAAGVAVNGALAAWRGVAVDRSALAEQSRAIEVEDLGVPGGRQDHYAAAYGGALALTFGRDETHVRRLPITPSLKESLERRCIVAYTGQSRISGDTITAVLGAYRARDRHVLQALARMKALARSMADELAEGHVDALGELVSEHWQHQRSLHPSIPTPLIDTILQRARAAGARGGKALGASGGGCVLVIAGEDNVDEVTAAVTSLAPHLVPVRIDESGLTCQPD